MVGGFLGLLGVIITLIYSTIQSRENRNFQEKIHRENKELQKELSAREYEDKIWLEKYNLLATLIGSRYDITGLEFSKSLNSIPAVFNESKEVLELNRAFHSYISSGPTDSHSVNERLVALFKAMFKDLGIDKNLVADDFLKAYNIVK